MSSPNAFVGDPIGFPAKTSGNDKILFFFIILICIFSSVAHAEDARVLSSEISQFSKSILEPDSEKKPTGKQPDPFFVKMQHERNKFVSKQNEKKRKFLEKARKEKDPEKQQKMLRDFYQKQNEKQQKFLTKQQKKVDDHVEDLKTGGSGTHFFNNLWDKINKRAVS